MNRIVFFLGCLHLFFCSCTGNRQRYEEGNMPFLDMYRLKGRNSLNMRPIEGEFLFTQGGGRGALFLENTSSVLASDIQDLTSYQNWLYLLLEGKIHRFSLDSGSYLGAYGEHITAFDLDTVTREVYAVREDNNRKQLIRYDVSGELLGMINMPGNHSYDQLRVTAPGHVVVTVEQIPDPVVLTADFHTLVFEYLIPPVGANVPLPASLTEREKKLFDPLYIFSSNKEGVLMKYAFCDTVYLCGSSSLDPHFIFKMSEFADRKKDFRTYLVERTNVHLLGFWSLENGWLVKYAIEARRQHFFFQYNKEWGVTLDRWGIPIGGPCIWQSDKKEVYHLDAWGPLYRNKENTRFLTVHRYRPLPGEGPEHVEETQWTHEYFAYLAGNRTRTGKLPVETIRPEWEDGILLTWFRFDQTSRSPAL